MLALNLAPHTANRGVRRLVRPELLATTLIVLAFAPAISAQATLDFSTVSRMASGASPNQVFTFSGTFMGSGGGTLGVTITVDQNGSLGGFPTAIDNLNMANTAPSPYKDGEDTDGGDDVTLFGLDTQTDLGVLFDPSPVGGTSPLVITMTFEGGADVGGLEFLITDIDSSETPTVPPGGVPDFRRDQVEIVAINDMAMTTTPSLMIVNMADPSFEVLVPGTARALGDPGAVEGAPADTDRGNLLVSFPGERITSVTVTYTDQGGMTDPAARGIGLFAELTIDEPVPVELMSFSIE